MRQYEVRASTCWYIDLRDLQRYRSNPQRRPRTLLMTVDVRPTDNVAFIISNTATVRCHKFIHEKELAVE